MAFPSALTSLSEEERLVRDSVYEFADREIRQLVREMDEHAKIPRPLIDKLFALGVMGIEIPESLGGGGAGFFHAVLAVESLSRVDPSIGVLVDVQNTLVVNALLAGAATIEAAFFPASPRRLSGLTRCRRPDPAATRSRWRRARCGAFGDWVLNGRKLWITNALEADLFLVFANADPAAGYRGVTAFLVECGSNGFTVGKKEDKLGIRASSTCELILEDCDVPAANVLGEAGKGYKVAIETLNEGRIGIGAQMIGLARGALDHAIVSRTGAVRQADRQLPGGPAQIARAATGISGARRWQRCELRDAGLPFVRKPPPNLRVGMAERSHRLQ